MNKSIGEARKLMSPQKVLERSDNKVLAIKTHGEIRDGEARVPQSLRALRPKLDAHKYEPFITIYTCGKNTTYWTAQSFLAVFQQQSKYSSRTLIIHHISIMVDKQFQKKGTIQDTYIIL